MADCLSLAVDNSPLGEWFLTLAFDFSLNLATITNKLNINR